ncbi:MAG TPA: asparaginase [Gaiella sp.]|nr:asparaginase [Gaiella sp.]
MEPIVVEVTRGPVVEARHVVHAVAISDGKLELALGDPGLVTFLRSSAKPLQALPTVRARPDLDDEEIALMCASHLAAPEQLAVVRRLLAAAPAREDELECGIDDSRIEHNCSGKHAGLLALCRARGWPSDGYRLAGHPCQEAMLAEIAAAAGLDPAAIPTAIDGCGVLTFGLTLERAATAFGRLPRLDGGERVVRAMRANPDLLRGPVALDVQLIRSLDGWFAKGGAEGLLCAASADGLVLALKVMDGSFRALAPALTHVLGRLGVEGEALGGLEVTNARRERVGELRVVR